MTRATIERRLERLESADSGAGRVVVMERYEAESDDDAEARWHAQHPGERIPAAALCVVLVNYGDSGPEAGG